MATIMQSVLAINPDAKLSVSGEDIDRIEWLEGTTPIAKETILAKQAELRVEYDALAWKRNRQAEYPDAIECVHALLDGGDTLTDLQAQRTAVKEKYSKG